MSRIQFILPLFVILYYNNKIIIFVRLYFNFELIKQTKSYAKTQTQLKVKLKPKSKTKFFPLFILSCIPSPVPANCHINFSSKLNNLYFIYILFSLSKLPPHIHSLFIFTSSFCLFPSSFCSTVTPTSCYHLRFVLLISQPCVSCCRSRFIVSFLLLLLFFLPSPFFPKISLSRYEKFLEFTFRPGRNGTVFKILVHTMSEKRKKNTARTPESSESYRYRCLTCANTGTFPKMMCRCNLNDNPQTKSSLIDIYKKSISDK